MFELVGAIVEALVGYIIGSFQAKSKVTKQISIIAVSLLCGFIFFIAYGIYELLLPSPNAPQNWLLILILFSLAASFATYLILNIGMWWKNRKSRNGK